MTPWQRLCAALRGLEGWQAYAERQVAKRRQAGTREPQVGKPALPVPGGRLDRKLAQWAADLGHRPKKSEGQKRRERKERERAAAVERGSEAWQEAKKLGALARYRLRHGTKGA